MDQSLRRAAIVLHKTVTVAISVSVDPVQGSLYIRPEPLEQGTVAGPFVVCSGQDHEQGSGIHAAVVAPERYLTEDSHLAVAGLVQDLAGLGILFRVHLAGLIGSQIR